MGQVESASRRVHHLRIGRTRAFGDSIHQRTGLTEISADDLEDSFRDREVCQRICVIVDGAEQSDYGILVSARRRQACSPIPSGSELTVVPRRPQSQAIDYVGSSHGFTGIAGWRELVGDNRKTIAEGLRVFVEIQLVQARFKQIAQKSIETLALLHAFQQKQCVAHAL